MTGGYASESKRTGRPLRVVGVFPHLAEQERQLVMRVRVRVRVRSDRGKAPRTLIRAPLKSGTRPVRRDRVGLELP